MRPRLLRSQAGAAELEAMLWPRLVPGAAADSLLGCVCPVETRSVPRPRLRSCLHERLRADKPRGD
jgi:hypothetical protein